MNGFVKWLLKRYAVEELLKYFNKEIPKRLKKIGVKLTPEIEELIYSLIEKMVAALEQKGRISEQQRQIVNDALQLEYKKR